MYTPVTPNVSPATGGATCQLFSTSCRLNSHELSKGAMTQQSLATDGAYYLELCGLMHLNACTVLQLHKLTSINRVCWTAPTLLLFLVLLLLHIIIVCCLLAG